MSPFLNEILQCPVLLTPLQRGIPLTSKRVTEYPKTSHPCLHYERIRALQSKNNQNRGVGLTIDREPLVSGTGVEENLGGSMGRIPTQVPFG